LRFSLLAKTCRAIFGLDLGTLEMSVKTPVFKMTIIPAQNIFSANPAINLDIAAKAAALPSAEIPAAPPTIPAKIAAAGGVPAVLQQFFKYKSTETTADFSLLLPLNSRLAAMLGSELAGIQSIPRLVAVAFAGTANGVAAPAIAGASSLEQFIYALAATTAGAMIETEIIAGQTYRKITGSYQKTPTGGGSELAV
jgi:hypothetical protein